ncbi:MAG: HTH-type transcriptional regulator AscG [Candidatus Hydrogenedentes bacterium ADurb.Bin179]|nr:MAG: HTH-type transcriptional regulator AscG [Candidatus Hydrogenedentes bacterium ADurb.Bin179]
MRALDADIGLVAGYHYTPQLLRQSPKITAIAYMNDLLAIGGMRYLSERQIPIPKRLSVTGFDDLCLDSVANPENRLGDFVTPALTTVRTPLHEMGWSTMQLLVEMVKKQEGRQSLPTLIFEPELIIRESTAPPHQ